MATTWYPQCRAEIGVVFDGFGVDPDLLTKDKQVNLSALDTYTPTKDGDTRPTIVQVLPFECTVRMNGYKEADTFDMTFDARVLPFSPELIRGASVRIYMFESDGLVADVGPYAKDDNTVMYGIVDNASFTWGTNGHTFHLDGRDYTALFLDKPFPANTPIQPGSDLKTTMEQLVKLATQRIIVDANGKITKKESNNVLEVVWEAASSPSSVSKAAANDPTLRKDKANITPPKKSKRDQGAPPTVIVGSNHSRSHKHGIPVKNGSSYWDVMYKLCLMHGYICFVRGKQVVISDPKTINQRSTALIPKVAFGRNIDELTVERHLGKDSVPQIKVIGRSRTGDIIFAIYPEHAPPRRTGVSTAKDELRVYTAGEVADIGVLKLMAAAQYHALGNTEAVMHFTTGDLRSLPGNDSVAGDNLPNGVTRDTLNARGQSLMQLRPGGAVQVAFDPFMTQELRTMPPSARYGKLLSLGYSPTVALLVANGLEHITQFRVPYYVRHMSFSWSQDGGMNIECEGVNFVVPKRDDAAAPQGHVGDFPTGNAGAA